MNNLQRLENLINTLWAKSDGTTIREHTDKLLQNLETLEELYGCDIEESLPQRFKSNFWNLLELACKYHDYGKIHCKFQQKVGNKTFNCPKGVEKEIKHNLVSPAFLYLFEGNHLNEEELYLVALAILHHHRVPDNTDVEDILNLLTVEFGLEPNGFRKFYRTLLGREEYGFFKGKKVKNPLLKRREVFKGNPEELKKTYILLKGFLLRLDHSGSVKQVDLTVEKPPVDTEKVLKETFQNEGKKLNDLQEFVLKNKDKNLLAVAQTGYGKTEAGALFLKRKGFFTLPVRTAINSIYERFKNYFGSQKVGLLHSSATSYLVKREEETNKGEGILETLFGAKHFSQPLIVCTPDQILPFTFHYEGFEKVLSLFSYARIVVDEIQSYEPHTLAFIVEALKEIAAFGGKFLITTATLPAFLREELVEIIDCEATFITDKIRHNISFINEEITSERALNQIAKYSKKGKVLVIANTVERAKEIKNLLREKEIEAKLLHSRFIRKDRQHLEREIEEFFRKGERGVWITTQLAEASLNIDADFLFTEISTADSFVQRLGRVNRFGKKTTEEPNVFVYTQSPSGLGTVYPRTLLELTLNGISQIGNGKWDEEKKLYLVETVYSKENLIGTRYFENYKRAKDYIESLHSLGLREDKGFALQMFRNILDITVIPERFKDEVCQLLELYQRETDYVEKLKIREQILDYTVSVPLYWELKNPTNFRSENKLLQKWSIKFANLPYGENGLEPPAKGDDGNPTTVGII